MIRLINFLYFYYFLYLRSLLGWYHNCSVYYVLLGLLVGVVMSWNSDTFHKNGNKHRIHGKYNNAIREYNKAIRLKEIELASIYIDKAKSLRLAGRYATALNVLDTVHKMMPHLSSSYSDVHVERANIYVMQDRIDDAIELYKHAILLDDNDILAHYNLGVLLYNNKNSDLGLECFNKVITIFDTLYSSIKQQKELSRLMQSLLRQVASLSYYFKGVIGLRTFEQNRINAVAIDFANAIKFSVNDQLEKLSVHFLCGVSYIIACRLNKAVNFLTDAVKLSIDDTSKLKARYCRGIAYLRSNSYDNALSDFMSLTDLDSILDSDVSPDERLEIPTDDFSLIKQDAYYCCGLAYVGKARLADNKQTKNSYFVDAINSFSRVVQFNVKNIVTMQAYYNRGLAYLELGSQKLYEKNLVLAEKASEKLTHDNSKIDQEWQPDVLSIIDEVKINAPDFIL